MTKAIQIGNVQYGSPKLVPGYRPDPSTSSSSVTDADVLDNKTAAAKLGITIPGVGDRTKITSSSGSARTDESKTGTMINGMSAPTYVGPTNNLSYLDQYEKLLDRTYDQGNNSINSTYDADLTDLKDAQNKETGSTSTQVARAGGYLGYSGSGAGVLQNLVVTHRNEMNSLEAKRQASLQAAREGFATKSMALAQERLAEAKSYEQEAYNRKQQFFQDMQKYTTAQSSAENEVSIANAIKGGAHDAQSIFEKLGGVVPLDQIEKYITGASKEYAAPGSFSFDKGDITKLIGSGFAQDEIHQIQEYVNTNGYTDALRKTLTPREKSVPDSIYYPKTAGAGTVGGSISIAEAKSLGLPLSLIGKSQEQVIAELSSNTPPSWYTEYVRSGFADPSQPVNTNDPALKAQWNTFRNNVLGENVSGNTYAVNAPKKGAAGGTATEPDFNTY